MDKHRNEFKIKLDEMRSTTKDFEKHSKRTQEDVERLNNNDKKSSLTEALNNKILVLEKTRK